MSGLKRNEPALMFGGAQVTPDEIDSYTVYHIINPGTAHSWFGTAAPGSLAAVLPFVVTTAIADYPRNVNLVIRGNGTNTAITGTAVINGKDQFGSVISETISITSGTGAGSQAGTKVFAQFISGTVTLGTMAQAGTPSLGFSVGTSTLFGLPCKIAGTGDVVLLSHNAGTGAIAYNGGTIGAYVNATMHAIQPAAAITGTESIMAWVESNYNPMNIGEVSALRQR
jgi:hypothetical protein